MPGESYKDHVEKLEAGLPPYAKKSFESFSPKFIDGGGIHDFYETLWKKTPSGIPKLQSRTPLQLERDRILYSPALRKQTEKYHVLYNGQRRIVRNYTTHTMRMAQVTRAICRGLSLNGDFAEAMALGAKAGAAPFIHASKRPIADWIIGKVKELDVHYAAAEPLTATRKTQLALEFGDASLPGWIGNLQSSKALEGVRKFIPWAAGKNVDHPYSSGQQSYWLLCTNPYSLEANPHVFCPETMTGIWCHTRGIRPERDSFYHKYLLDSAPAMSLEMKWDHFTYEASVVQYADDVTWVIENLNDANSAALLNKRSNSVYADLVTVLSPQDAPEGLLRSLNDNDSGGIYTYFIADFVNHSRKILDKLGDGAYLRQALREGTASGYIGLSPEAEVHLDKCSDFLQSSVFNEARVKNRANMLRTVSLACLDLLYSGWADTLPTMIREKATLERWTPAKLAKAIDLLRDPFHRIQAAVDVFVEMGDQEIYDFVGIQAL
ncbi:MAG: hypothetical protein ACLGSH_11105 [Acidobacteriota bacterium]